MEFREVCLGVRVQDLGVGSEGAGSTLTVGSHGSGSTLTVGSDGSGIWGFGVRFR